MSATTAEIAAGLDAALTRPVLVVGSLPPEGRDLDLLAREDDAAVLRRRLSSLNFLDWRGTWVRFDPAGSPYAVDLGSAARWGRAQDVLFEDAEPIPGYRHLVRPAPGTVLVLAARGMVTRRGRVTDKVRRRVAAALEHDPGAWTDAERRARPLGAGGAVTLLRAACAHDAPLAPKRRAAGLMRVASAPGPLPEKLRVLADLRPRHWRPAVVSFSGLDGSGKSTQVSRLAETLGEVGVPASPQWAGFKTGAIARRALPFLDRPLRATPPGEEPPTRDPLLPAALVGRPLPRQAWLTMVVGLNVISLWRYVLKPRPGVKVLVFDRFSPDTAVKLELHYADTRGLDIRWPRWLFRTLAPTPDAGFLVAVPSDVAYERRQDQTPEELAAMARFYDQQQASFGLVRLDGTRPPLEIASEVAPTAWRRLR